MNDKEKKRKKKRPKDKKERERGKGKGSTIYTVECLQWRGKHTDLGGGQTEIRMTLLLLPFHCPLSLPPSLSVKFGPSGFLL